MYTNDPRRVKTPVRRQNRGNESQPTNPVDDSVVSAPRELPVLASTGSNTNTSRPKTEQANNTNTGESCYPHAACEPLPQATTPEPSITFTPAGERLSNTRLNKHNASITPRRLPKRRMLGTSCKACRPRTVTHCHQTMTQTRRRHTRVENRTHQKHFDSFEPPAFEAKPAEVAA